MNLTRTSLNNPAAMVVVVTLVLVFGTLSLLSLPIQLMPNIERPQININTGWRAAAPQELEAVIIEPLENVVKNIPGVTDISTNINPGFGNINLTFEIGTDMQQAMLDVLSRLNQAPPLPLDAFDPVVSSGGGGQGPTAASLLLRPIPGNPIKDLNQYQKLIDDIVEPRLSRIPGIASVNLNSRRPRELRISFDPYKLAALQIPISTISSTVAQATDVSAGFSDVGRRSYTVRFAGQFNRKNLQDMIITYSDNIPVYLRDIATVEETLVDRVAFTLRDGVPGYYITISRANDANTVAVLDELNKAITELNQGALAAEGLMIDLSFDASVHIRNAISMVNSNLGMGILLAIGVLWFFLRGLKTTLIIATTIPISLLVAFLALSLFDRSLNVISLAGLAFAVGMVLDAAIIVQENIVRLRHDGMDNRKAVLRGTMQVTGALFASTVTSVAIFLPILFMDGIEGQLFSDLALTLSIAVTASMLAAITILPVASRFWLNKLEHQDPFEKYWDNLTAFVMKFTSTPLKRGIWISSILGGSVVVALLLMPRSDFLPRAPIDGFFYNINQPPGTNLKYVEDELAPLVRKRIQPYFSGEKEPAIKNYNFYTFNGSNTGGFIYSADPKRTEELMDIARNEIFKDLPDTQVFLFRGSMLNFAGGNSNSNITLNIQGSNIEQLMNAASIGIGAIQKAIPDTYPQPRPGLTLSEPEIQLIPNDRRISQSGMSRRQVADAVRAMTDGLFISEYFDGNDRMNVVLRGNQWQSPEQFAALPLYTPNSGIQTLGELAEVKRTVGPSQLLRVDGKRTVSLSFLPPAGLSMEEALESLRINVIPKIEEVLPDDARVIFSGNANQLAETMSEMARNFFLALLILFLIMAALFKSAKDSVLVLFVMPLAIAGGVLALSILNIFTTQTLDLLTMIGFIILLGLVVNNAILLVDQTRTAERQGSSRQQAVTQAVRIRTRPIYMSTLTSLFGMLPLMLMPGVGSEIYRGLATVIVGGMAVSTLLTLFLLPSLLRLGEDRAMEKNEDKIRLKTTKTALTASSG